MTTSKYIPLPEYLALLETHNWQYLESNNSHEQASGAQQAQLLKAYAQDSQPRQALYRAVEAAKDSGKVVIMPQFNIKNLTKLVSGGQIFAIEFIKRSTGELRSMQCRTGVKKHLKGGTKAYTPKDHNLLCVYDLAAKGYRSVPVENVLSMTVSGQRFVFAGQA